MSRRRVLVGGMLAVLATGCFAPVARGDADPASDVLLYQAVYYPYRPVVDAKLKAQLDGLTARAAQRKYPVRVAIIASPYDLGAVTSYFNDPRGYADFLEEEISMHGPQPLIVVMPGGIATAALPTRVADAALADPPDLSRAKTDGLVRAAIRSLRRVLALRQLPVLGNGRPTPRPRLLHASSSNGTPLVLVFAPVAAVALIALVLASPRRRGRRGDRGT